METFFTLLFPSSLGVLVESAYIRLLSYIFLGFSSFFPFLLIMVLYQDLGTRLHKTVLLRKKRRRVEEKQKGASSGIHRQREFFFFVFWFIRLHGCIA